MWTKYRIAWVGQVRMIFVETHFSSCFPCVVFTDENITLGTFLGVLGIMRISSSLGPPDSRWSVPPLLTGSPDFVKIHI